AVADQRGRAAVEDGEQVLDVVLATVGAGHGAGAGVAPPVVAQDAVAVLEHPGGAAEACRAVHRAVDEDDQRGVLGAGLHHVEGRPGRHRMRTIRSTSVAPSLHVGEPASITTMSSWCTRPASTTPPTAYQTSSSSVSHTRTGRGTTPQLRVSWRTVRSDG